MRAASEVVDPTPPLQRNRRHVGVELIAEIQEHCFYHLEAPLMRVTGWDTPYPHAFEWEYFPGPKRVGDALRRVMEDA